jgi:hypothetical protein
MTSRRTTLIVYGLAAFWLIGLTMFMVTFPEYGPQLEFALTSLVIVGGVGFVVGGLFRRDLSLLVIGTGFLMGMYGTRESIHWITLLASPITLAGFVWMIKNQAVRA